MSLVELFVMVVITYKLLLNVLFACKSKYSDFVWLLGRVETYFQFFALEDSILTTVFSYFNAQLRKQII